MNLVIPPLLLWVGIAATAYAISEPGSQVWASVLGGACVGLYTAWE